MMATVEAIWHTGNLVPGQLALDAREFEGWDIHVVRGATSLPLRSILALVEDNSNVVRADAAHLPADVIAIDFIGQFAGMLENNVLSGGGVSLNAQTGEVEATLNPPTPRLRSFLISPSVQRTGGAGPLAVPPIRVQIHESVTEIWLTPSPFTIAGDADGQRFSVLARFDDDTIGDITRLASAPLAPGQPPEPGFKWKSDDNVCVQPDHLGRLTGVFGLFPCTATITATLKQAGWPPLSTSAEVTVVAPWGDQPPAPRRLHLLSGPGLSAVSAVPNILILPDGFLDEQGDRDDFYALASLAVTRLNRSPITFPFSALDRSINYWSAFVPSRERGTSTLDELRELATLFEGPTQAAKTPVTTLTVDRESGTGDNQIDLVRATLDGELPAGVHFTIAGDPTVYTTMTRVVVQAHGLHGVRFTPALSRIAAAGASVTIIGRRIPVPRGQPAEPGAAAWTIENLVNVVGLPVAAERLTHGSTDADLKAKIDDWTTLYGAPIQRSRITRSLYDSWARLLPDHRLADEKDTALGLATGERPRADIRQSEQVITWHPLRTQRTHLDKFLATLEFDGTVVGSTWIIQPGGAPGKDRNLVFVLARGAPYSGSNRAGPEPIIALSVVEDRNVRVRYGSGRSMQIVSHAMKRDSGNVPAVTNFVHATFAHEAAHTFRIADEYGGGGALPPGGARGLLQVGNVTPAGEITAVRGITGERLRWRWPRISKAGVLAAVPLVEPGVPGTFAIQLRAGHQTTILRVGHEVLPGEDVFRVGDVVFLRQRSLLRAPAGVLSQPNQAVVSVALVVIEPGPTRALAVDELLVRVQSGTLFPATFSDIGADASILFAPVPAAASAAAKGDSHAEIMAQFIRQHVTDTARPLNAAPPPPAPPPVPEWVCTPPSGDGFMEPQTATNLPLASRFPGGHRPAITSRIVGAYEGGAEFDCGVFHPSGICIMRSQLATSDKNGDIRLATGSVNEFCYVCRYLLVDSVDPRQHGAIDARYDTYPQP